MSSRTAKPVQQVQAAMRSAGGGGRRRGAAFLLAASIALAVFELLLQTGALTGWVLLLLPFIAGLAAGTYVTHERRSAAVGALVPLAILAPSAYPASALTQILVLAIIALGLNVLTGWTGQINLAQGVFVAVGAYTTALLTTREHWPVLATIPVAGVLAALLGLLLGIVALRFAGVYLAILTTALALVAPIVLKHYGTVTGGASGVSVPRLQPSGTFGGFSADQLNYTIVLVLAVLAAVVTSNMLRGRIGRALWFVRDSPVAAAGVGIDVTRYKVLAFTVSSFWGGIGGAAYALTIGFVTPDAFGLFYGVQFLTMIVVGGLSTVGGAFIGAFLVYELSTNVQTIGLPLDIAGQPVSLPQQAVFGLILIATVLLLPAGITGLLYKRPAQHLASVRQVWGRARGHTDKAAPTVPAPPPSTFSASKESS